MPWFFNFCSPHLPNDPTINFHRYVQTGSLAALLVLYTIVHIYYKVCGPDPNKKKTKDQNVSDNSSQNQKGSDQNSQNHHEDDKSISIAGGCAADQNSSYMTFNTFDKKKKMEDETKKKAEQEQDEKVNIKQVQGFFPIVYGHFSIACALTITYSPYAEQTIAIAVYILLALILVIVNAKRKIKTTRFIWGLMCFIICFLAMSGLLEVGQANYNKIEKQCFSVGYQSLY